MPEAIESAAGVEKRPVFEQPILPIQDEKGFGEVLSALEQAFNPAKVQSLLKEMDRAKLRARNFEGVLAKGLLGKAVPMRYASLGDSDRGQVRERYLRMVEHVAPELRARFLKVYAYY